MADKKVLFGGEHSLEQLHKWKIVDKAGSFQWIDKAKLQIDHQYQRDNVNADRVNKIAADWTWVAFGVLIVARRKDDTYWVVDGQHRKLAADKRTSVTNLPCMVFKMAEVPEEAEGFLSANTLRGPVSSYDKFRCKLACKDKVALAVQAMVEDSKYQIARNGKEKNGVCCVALLTRCQEMDPSIATRMWKLCVEICDGEHMHENLYSGMFTLECKFSKSGISLADRCHKDKLISVGQEEILKRMRELKIGLGKGGSFVSAQAIVLLLNKSKKTNKLPDVLRSMSSAD